MKRRAQIGWLVIATLAGCGGGTPASSTAASLDRWRISLDDVDPNGLAWDAAAHRLYVADDDGARIVVVSDGDVVDRLALEGAGSGAGGVVTTDGGIATARFGAHGDAQVWASTTDSALAPLSGIDPARHRLGVAVREGTLFSAWFSGSHDAWVGGVSSVPIGGADTERDVMTGLGKVVGVAVRRGELFASDQTHDVLVRCTLPACDDLSTFATVPAPDLITTSASEVWVSSRDGHVYRVDASGAVRIALSDVGGQPRGLAIDEAAQYLFVAVHDPAPEHPEHVVLILDLQTLD